MKTSIHQNILFVVVISLSIASMFPATHARHHKEPRKALNDRSFAKHSEDFLEPPDVGRLLTERDALKTEKKKLDSASGLHRSKHSKQKIEKYKNAVINFLGINKPGRPDREIAVPQFMLDLYKQRVTKNAWTSQGRKYRSVHYFEAEIVRSFGVEIKGLLMKHSDPNVILKSAVDGHHFHDEDIIGAELRIFYGTEGGISTTATSTKRRRLEVYHVERRRYGGYRRLLDINYFENEPSRWMSFNVTEALKFIHKDSKLHMTFEMNDKIDDENHKKNHQESVGEMNPLLNDSRYQPVLIIYSNNKLNRQQLSQNRPKRSSSDGNRYPRRGSHSHRQRMFKQFQKQCSRRPLYVDFAELDWLEWIVAPSGFHAFLCQGTCQREIQHYNATNHAVLQSLLHFKNPTIVPATCCVPTQLSSMALLIVDFDTVVLKNYKDMIVDSCGCR